MPTAPAVLIGGVVVVIGLAFMLFRVPVATFFREARERKGSRNAASQTPGLVFMVGAGFFLVGAFIVVGTFAGWVHPH